MIKRINKNIQKILIIKNDKIGDMVLSTGIFRELKKNFPKAEITVIASKSNKQIIEKNKNIDRIIVLDYPPKGYRGILNYFGLSKELKKEDYDVGIDLRGSVINIFFLLILAGVKYRIGFYNRYFSKFLLNYAYKKDRKNKHVTFQRIDLINKALNLNSKDYWPDIAFDEEDERQAKNFMKKNGLKKFICLVPDASLEAKQWPLKKFDELIKSLQRSHSKYKIVLLGSDRNKMEWLKNNNADVIVPEELLDLRVTSILFKKSQLVITHDGGPMHLAWANRAKLIALMPKYLNLNYYKPLGKEITILSENIKNLESGKVANYADKILRSA